MIIPNYGDEKLNLQNAGRLLSILFALLILVNFLNYAELELKSVFLIKWSLMLIICVLIMLYTPGFTPNLETAGLGTWLLNFLRLLGGVVVTMGALLEENEGGSGLSGFLYLAILYSSSAGLLAFPIVSVIKPLLFRGSSENLTRGSWGHEDYIRVMTPGGSKNDLMDDSISRRVREAVIEVIEEDPEIGKSVHKPGATEPIQKNLLKNEIGMFSGRPKSAQSIAMKLRANPNMQVKSNLLHLYVESRLVDVFERRMLINIAKGTKSNSPEVGFEGADGNNATVARNLIHLLGMDRDGGNLFVNGSKNFGLEYKNIMRRQMAMFLHIFSKIFSREVENQTIAISEGKMITRGIMKYVLSNSGNRQTLGEIDEVGWEAGDYYRTLKLPSEFKVEGDTEIEIKKVLDVVPTFNLGIKRLDHASNHGGLEGDPDSESLLESLVDSCWDFFQASEHVGG